MHQDPFSSAAKPVSPPWELLDRYFTGEISRAERMTVDEWVDSRTGGDKELLRLRRLWMASSQSDSARSRPLVPDVDRALSVVHAQMESPRTGMQPRKVRSAWIAVFPIFAIVVGLWVGMYHGRGEIGRQGLSTSTLKDVAHIVSYHAARGQRVVTTLPDGSQIMLNAASTLTMTAQSGTSARDIVIDGEAIFTVAPNARIPFIVRTPDTRVTVLGTTFGVRAYQDDAQTRVVVLQGRVAVNDSVLQPGDIALTSPGNAFRSAPGSVGHIVPVTISRNQDVAAMTAWSRGQLSFSHTPFATVVADLERAYDVRIRSEDPALNERTITGVFTARTVDELVAALAFVLNVRVTIHGQSLVLHTLAGLPLPRSQE